MPARTATLVAWVVCVLLGAARANALEIGIFFDENAESCVAEIQNFGPAVKAHVFAFVSADTALNGAVLRLELDSGFVVRNEEAAKGQGNGLEGEIASPTGVDVTLAECPPGGAPVLLMTFDLELADPDLKDPVADVRLKLRGGTVVADSLDLTEPNLKVCDPDDPLGGDPELKPAVALQATLNCTSECPCTVAVQRRTWAELKRLYLEP